MGSDPVRPAADRLLGRELRRCREARGLTLRQVAPVIRGSVSKISRLERGESPPRPRDVRDLARYYGVDADEMRAERRLRLMNRPLPRVTARSPTRPSAKGSTPSRRTWSTSTARTT
ncbi:helix-turn-helix domain-containing protein [Streptomyces sp. NPDC051704]|uniref:helix-turn-helix domain-containing protein n=1 Tax=Streptomyces sp. NPDC051704 TaxID=3365671 RepID=UPI0037B153D9